LGQVEEKAAAAEAMELASAGVRVKIPTVVIPQTAAVVAVVAAAAVAV
jgi:hypothetical protein